MATYAVMETKTGVILVEGSYDYCKTWIENTAVTTKNTAVGKTPIASKSLSS